MSQQTPLMTLITRYLGVRNNKQPLRFPKEQSSRSVPKPNLPPGVNHKLSDNYYHSRDARREQAPPLIIASAQKQIADNSKIERPKIDGDIALNLPTPGFQTRWTESSDY